MGSASPTTPLHNLGTMRNGGALSTKRRFCLFTGKNEKFGSADTHVHAVAAFVECRGVSGVVEVSLELTIGNLHGTQYLSSSLSTRRSSLSRSALLAA